VFCSSSGIGGVLFFDFRGDDGFPPRRCVLKRAGDAVEAANILFCRQLCSRLVISHPEVRLLCQHGKHGRDALCARASTAVASSPEDEVLKGRVESILRPGGTLLVMQFVCGTALACKEDSEIGKTRMADLAVQAAVGRIMALDIAINNWDRFPLPVTAWVPQWSEKAVVVTSDAGRACGNIDNVLYCSDGSFATGSVIAIDTEPKLGGAFQNQSHSETLFLEEMASVVAGVHQGAASGQCSAAVEALADFFEARGGCVLGVEALMAVQAACSETLHTLWKDIRPEFDGMYADALCACGVQRDGTVVGPGMPAAGRELSQKARASEEQIRSMLCLCGP